MKRQGKVAAGMLRATGAGYVPTPRSGHWLAALCVLGIAVGSPVNGWAAEHSNGVHAASPSDTFEIAQSTAKSGAMDGAMGGAHDHAADAACHIEVELTDAAERQLGGALYTGPTLTPDEILATMKQAHLVHHPQHGGSFAMAPNKMNHVEVVYSESCGVRVYLYNAYTRHIRVDRFMAFVKFVPRDEEQFEAIRFVEPSMMGDYLGTGADHGVEPPFDIELFMKFPGSDMVELFNIKPNFKQRKLFVGVGEVVTIDSGRPGLVIDHEAIPGYMGAMTMPYAVTGAELLDRVKPGMRIRFKINAERGVIVAIEPIGR